MGRSGLLVRVDLLLARLATTTASLTLEVRDGAAVLASRTVMPAAGDALFPEWGWQSFDLSAGAIDVRDGDVLSLVLSSAGGTRISTCEEWCWGSSDQAAYARGAYSTSPDIDMTFVTWVDDAPGRVPEPGSLPLAAAAALAALATVARRRRKPPSPRPASVG